MREPQPILFVLVILIVSACSSAQNTPASKLIGKPWVLSSFMGADPDLSKFTSGVPTLNFLEGSRLAGFAGCNDFSGEYTLTGSDIKLDPGAITRKACPGSGESEFITAIENVQSLTFENEELILRDGAIEVMSFSPKKD